MIPLHDSHQNNFTAVLVKRLPTSVNFFKFDFKKFWYFADRTSQYIYLDINQLDALNFIMSLFHASTCFEHYVVIVRRSKLYYTASGTITPIGGRPMHRMREDSTSQPMHGKATYRCDGTRCCTVQFWSPDDEHMCSKHVEAWNKLIIKFCASSWLILRWIDFNSHFPKF